MRTITTTTSTWTSDNWQFKTKEKNWKLDVNVWVKDHKDTHHPSQNGLIEAAWK